MAYTLRLILLLSASLVAMILILQASSRARSDEPKGHTSDLRTQNSFEALFSFGSPGSLFPPSAIISLTDDNSTFFLARPAAFGPDLPENGLSSPLWTGSGFGSEASGKSELGCDDGLDSNEGHDNFGIQYVQRHARLRGKVVLLKRGECGFLEKVLWAQNRGAVAVIVGDDVRGGGLVRMYAKGDTSNVTIPSVFTSYTTAHLLSSLVRPHDTVHWAEKDRIQPQIKNHAGEIAGIQTSDSNGIDDERLQRHAEKRSNSDTTGGRVLNGHEGLWVTLTPTSISTSPFFDTLLVLVVSPLVTLTVVYALLLLRSRIRRRRWRAPKSLVERLPVRTYQTMSSSSSLATSNSSSPSTPLLQRSQSQSQTSEAAPTNENSTSRRPASEHQHSREEEKRGTGLAEWKRRYGGRQKECVVCLEEFVAGVSQVMSLPCGHEFHADCITPWLVTRRRTCPICKGDVVRSLARAYHEHSPSPSSSSSPPTHNSPSAHRNPISDTQERNDPPTTLSTTRASDSAQPSASPKPPNESEANSSGDHSRRGPGNE